MSLFILACVRSTQRRESGTYLVVSAPASLPQVYQLYPPADLIQFVFPQPAERSETSPGTDADAPT